jgi:endonuclease YncB( thermonuclease family)
MKKMTATWPYHLIIILTFATILALLASGALASWQPYTNTHGVRVVDGDTITIIKVTDRGKRVEERIRLWGINAKELKVDGRWNDEGLNASYHLRALIGEQAVLVEPLEGAAGKDKWGRTVARVYLNGQDVAYRMVYDGHAEDWPVFSRGRYAEAQRCAERAGVGMWHTRQPAVMAR